MSDDIYSLRCYKIYKHTFPNGKVYIGITKLNPKYRYGKDGHNYDSCPFMWNAIQKYGWENIKHEIIMDNLTVEEANIEERRFITEIYHSNNKKYGYNIANGGNYKGVASQKSINKMLKTRRKTAKKLGYWISEESKRKISSSNLGHPYYENCKKSNQRIKKDYGKKVMNIETGKIYDSIREATRDVKCKSHIHISRCCYGKENTCMGFHWKFV